MPIFFIYCEAEQENVTHLAPADLSKRLWGMELKCTRCNEHMGAAVTINPLETEEIDGGSHNFVKKCSCGHRVTVSVQQPSAKEQAAWTVKDGKPAIVAAFDCRGCEPCKVLAEGPWVAGNSDIDKEWKFNWNPAEEWSEYEQAIDDGAGGVAAISKITMSVRRS